MGEIDYSNFTGNRALGINSAVNPYGKTTTGGDGGAVIWTGSDGRVNYSNFINNTAAKRGGAVYLQVPLLKTVLTLTLPIPTLEITLPVPTVVLLTGTKVLPMV